MLVKEESPAILVRLEDGGHGAPLRTQLCQEICCHRLAVHDEVGQLQRFGRVFVAGEDSRNAIGQMQITAMRGRKQWMPLLVMQQHKCTTAQDFARVAR